MSEYIAPKHRGQALFRTDDPQPRKHDKWGVDSVIIQEVYNYEQTFAEALHTLEVTTFDELIFKRKSLSRENNILDVMGGGYFISPETYPQVDTMTGIRLGNPEEEFLKDLLFKIEDENNKPHKDDKYLKLLRVRLKTLKNLQIEPKRRVIHGSIYTLDIWRDLDRLNRKRGIKSHDVIVCRPVAPFSAKFLSRDQELNEAQTRNQGVIFDRVFQQTIARLSKGGVFFTEVPKIFSKEQINFWVAKKRDKEQLNIKVFAYPNTESWTGESLSLLVTK